MARWLIRNKRDAYLALFPASREGCLARLVTRNREGEVASKRDAVDINECRMAFEAFAHDNA